MTNEEPHPSDSRLGCLHFLMILIALFLFFHAPEDEKAVEYENI